MNLFPTTDISPFCPITKTTFVSWLHKMTLYSRHLTYMTLYMDWKD